MNEHLKRFVTGIMICAAGSAVVMLWGTQFKLEPGLVSEAVVHIGFAVSCVVTGTAMMLGGNQS